MATIFNPDTTASLLSKIKIGSDIYVLKDADARALLATLKTAALSDVHEGDISAGGDGLVTAAQVKSAIGGLSGAMHFVGTSTTDPSTSATVDGVDSFASGDVVLYGTKEYVYDGSKWVELGDESIYALKTTKIAGISIDGDISVAQLQSALGLGNMAYADTASGSITTIDSIDNISVGKAGEYSVTASSVSVPATYSALDVTPKGTITVNEGAAAKYNETTSVTVATAAPTEGQTANYTPAGTVTLPKVNVSVTMPSIKGVDSEGTNYEITDGSVTKAADTTDSFVKTATVADETLSITFGNAVTAAGDISYTAPVLSGALPTFAATSISPTDVTATYGTDSTTVLNLAGTGVMINATPVTSEANATVTQASYTFSGTAKSVTPTVATSVNAAGIDGKVTVSSDTVSLNINTSAKTVQVSPDTKA